MILQELLTFSFLPHCVCGWVLYEISKLWANVWCQSVHDRWEFVWWEK